MTDMIEKNETLVQESETKKEKRGKGKKIAFIVSSVIVTCIAFFAVWHLVIIPNNQYKTAETIMNFGNYQEAIFGFEALGNYKDSAEKIQECKYQIAFQLIESKNVQEAYAIFTELGNFRDAKQLLENFKWVKVKDIYDSDFTEYSYDAQGKCIKEEKTYSSGSWLITDYSYDGDGKCIREAYTDNYGNNRIFDYVYDEQGRRVKKINSLYNDSNYSYVYVNYTYDEQGNCVEERGWEWGIHYIYDEQGKCVREDHVGEGYRNIVDYAYDENGKVKKKVENEGISEDSKSTTTTEYFYDENGNCNMEIAKTDRSYDEKIVKHEYQFIYAAKE